MIKRPRALVLVLLAVTVLSAGCGDSAEAPVVTNTTTAAAKTVDASAIADRRIARASTLQLGDLPSGWSQPDDVGDGKKSGCFDAARKLATATATSPSFDSTSGRVANIVATFSDVQGAHSAVLELGSRQTRDCYRKALSGDMGEDVEIVDTATAVLGAPNIGDESVAFRLTGTVRAEGDEAEMVADVVVARTGRAISSIATVDVISAVDDSVRDDALSATIGRLDQGLTRGE